MPLILLTFVNVPSFLIEKKFIVREESWDLDSDDLGFGIHLLSIYPLIFLHINGADFESSLLQDVPT